MWLSRRQLLRKSLAVGTVTVAGNLVPSFLLDLLAAQTDPVIRNNSKLEKIQRWLICQP